MYLREQTVFIFLVFGFWFFLVFFSVMKHI
jgi:hypothetical protein